MKKSPTLFRQHIGWHFYKHWVVQGKRKIIDTGAVKKLQQLNIPVYKPEDLLEEKRIYEKIEIIGHRELPIPLDNTHPDWHDRPLLTYKDNNVLVEGLKQAKILTNTVEINDGLPDKVKISELTKDVDKLAKGIVLYSQLFDAEQQKLPKIKDPLRPAWNFPRIYGITQDRKNKLTTYKLLQLLEIISDRQVVKQRYVFDDLMFSFPFERDQRLVQLELSADRLLTSITPLSPVSSHLAGDVDLPSIHPVDPLITFNKENIYKILDVYPIKSTVRQSHPHTIFIHFNKEVVKNLYEEEVTEQQIFGRSLLKTFTVAASYAKQKYGNNVKELENPVTLQCVQTDGHFFHFGILQLNSLNLENGNVKNIWYQTPLQYLFDTCKYVTGKPTLEGYNENIIRQLHSFYKNV